MRSHAAMRVVEARRAGEIEEQWSPDDSTSVSERPTVTSQLCASDLCSVPSAASRIIPPPPPCPFPAICATALPLCSCATNARPTDSSTLA